MSRISATPTPRSPPTCSPATCASAARTSSSSRAPTSTASRWPRRPSARASPRASSPTATPSASASWRPRSTPPTTSSSAPPTRSTWTRSARSSSGSTTTAHVYEGTYEGWYCPRCADFKTESELVDGNKCPIHLIVLEREHEDNWFFRLSAFQEPLEQLYRRQAGLRDAGGPLQRGPFVHQGRPHRPLPQPRAAQVGRAGAVGPVAGGLRLDRRAPQLLHGALVRTPGGGPHRPLLAAPRST